MVAPDWVSFRSADVEMQVSAGRIQNLFVRAPGTAFFYFRDVVGSMFGSHRREWIARNQVAFKQKRTINKLFFYRVYPRKNLKPVPGAPVSLDQIKGETYTRSKMALAHERGGTITPTRGKALAIPIGGSLLPSGKVRKEWRTPAKFRAAFPSRELIALGSAGKRVLYEARRTKGGRRRKREGRDKLTPAFVLVPSVTLKPRLNFFKTWDQLSSDRGRRLAAALAKIVEAIGSGKSA